jgi:acylphosphatase
VTGENIFGMGKVSARHWIVKGAVQGVGFRFFVQRRATELGVRGWTRNLGDGSVEVYAAGEAAALSKLAAALHTGPQTAQVRSVDEHDDTVENISGFSIR